MENNDLNYLFNPYNCPYFFCSSNEENNKRSKKVSDEITEEERKYFNEICCELEDDLINLGMSINFATKIIIRKVTMNIIFLKKIVRQMYSFSFITEVPKNITPLNKGASRVYTPLRKDIDVHPFFEKLIFKFQKEIDNGLKQLGLLPVQQIERQKLVIVKKLKQKYKNMEEEYSIRAEKKITNNNKNNLSILAQKNKSHN